MRVPLALMVGAKLPTLSPLPVEFVSCVVVLLAILNKKISLLRGLTRYPSFSFGCYSNPLLAHMVA